MVGRWRGWGGAAGRVGVRVGAATTRQVGEEQTGQEAPVGERES